MSKRRTEKLTVLKKFSAHLDRLREIIPYSLRRTFFFLIQGIYAILFTLMQLRRTIHSPLTEGLFWVVGIGIIPIIALLFVEARFRRQKTGSNFCLHIAVTYSFLIVVCYFRHLNVYFLSDNF